MASKLYESCPLVGVAKDPNPSSRCKVDSLQSSDQFIRIAEEKVTVAQINLGGACGIAIEVLGTAAQLKFVIEGIKILDQGIVSEALGPCGTVVVEVASTIGEQKCVFAAAAREGIDLPAAQVCR